MNGPKAPERVLVIEIAGLGDNIHLLPALRALHLQWPDCELHVMVRDHVAELFTLVPWVRQVWAYPARPKPGLRANLRWGRVLRRQRYDLVWNTTGGDRASVLTWLSGAPRRVARRPSDGGPPGWDWLCTDVLEVPHWVEPMYVQKLRCVRAMGCSVPDSALAQPPFDVRVDVVPRRLAGVAAHDDHRYVHISPFTTAAARELPLTQIVALIDGLRRARPRALIALSCAPSAEEQARMAELLRLLPEPPWRVWPGTLGIAALASVIAGAAVSYSGDTGTLHAALMTGTPAVAWFRSHRGEREWIPPSPDYRVFKVEAPADAPHLQGIDTAALVDAGCGLFDNAASRR